MIFTGSNISARLICCTDLFGLEVCGIIEERDAELALRILQETFPEWPHSDVYYRRYGRERGWKALIHKHRDKRRRYQHI
jgi:hypothetical protein